MALKLTITAYRLLSNRIKTIYLLISPAVNVNSLSSAASKSYRALTFLGSLAGVVDTTAVDVKLVDGYSEELN